ncbi:NAD(P)/FAD-dependent oxidoreductase [Actinoplanes sp. NPDC051494]|uniref:NAD(P)/FAD-dependent oxidoreductase n=1 Tax=Actinoplanes sp. NPDC051494 TaxID=3363907 RepID=UPI0037B8F2DB
MPEHPRTTELLIIGAGVIGASIAYHAAEAGIGTVLLEPDAQATATATQTAGAFRTYFPGKVHDSELVARSLTGFREFAATTGVDLALTRTDMLVVAATPREAADLEAELPAQRAAGVQLELLTAEQVVARNRWLDPAGVEVGILCPQMIRLRADEVVRGYSEGALRHGARVLTGATVTGIDSGSGLVATTAGDITAETIVIAAGSGSGALAALAGLELPVWEQFAELFRTAEIGGAADVGAPFTFHPAAGLKAMGIGPAFLVGLERFSQLPSMREVWFKEAGAELAARYPRLRDVALHSAWTGSLEATASATALIGRAPGAHERILVAAGFTGHDLSQAPVTGQIIRDLHLGRDPGLDLTPFALA